MSPPVAPVTPRDYLGIAAGYVADVLAGRVRAGTWTVKACRRFDRMRRQADMRIDAGFFWSPEHVQDVCTFIERLPHVEGKWHSATIQLQPWQVWMLAAIYGFRLVPTVTDPNTRVGSETRVADGARLVRSVFFEVGRKSAKSTLVAACALYHLAVEDEPGAQVVCGATTGNQARIVFSIMQRMVRRSRWLRAVGFVAYANAVTFKDLSNAKPINAKSSTQDGLNPSFISLDESHAQDFELFDVLKSAQGARRNPLLLAPTTAGYSLTSVGYALRSAAMKILDGVIDSDHTFCVLYELDEGDNWRDETTWIKSLPMIGTTPSLDYVRKYRDDALATPGLQGEFEVKMCDRWLHSASTWLSMPVWDACADATLTLEQFTGEPCWIGGDLAQLDDLAAIALLFHKDDRLVAFVVHYLPEHVVEARSRAVPAYRAWVREGLLRLTAGSMIDYTQIERDLRGWCAQFDVRRITFDQFGSVQISSALATDGLPATVEPKNARTFTPPARELETRVRHGRFRHDGNSCLKWQASNCVVSRRIDDSILPKKDGPESPNKIDAIDAVLLAISGWLRQPESAEPTADECVFVV